MAKISFKDLGRQDWNGAVVIPDNCNADQVAEYAYREATKHLLSSPEVLYNAEKNEGTIFAGFHTVGTFSVQKGGE